MSSVRPTEQSHECPQPRAAREPLLSVGSLILVTGLQHPVRVLGADLSKFRPIEAQYITALGDPGATSGNGAQSWGLWSQDPGPRGCKLDRDSQLKADGVAPSQWKFDAADWWREEHGLIMEKPTFPLPPWQYPVTGDRDVTTVLTIQPKDKNGNQRWELANGATLYDVTHPGCRSARCTPATADNLCSLANVRTTGFPVNPGAAMPVGGRRSRDPYPSRSRVFTRPQSAPMHTLYSPP
jgi:hypothetical protein